MSPCHVYCKQLTCFWTEPYLKTEMVVSYVNFEKIFLKQKKTSISNTFFDFFPIFEHFLLAYFRFQTKYAHKINLGTYVDIGIVYNMSKSLDHWIIFVKVSFQVQFAHLNWCQRKMKNQFGRTHLSCNFKKCSCVWCSILRSSYFH